MRRLLDAIYDGAAALAAASMVGLLIMVLLSIVGRELNFHVRGTDAYAGYLMAAAGFLTLLLQSAGPGLRRVLELWSLLAASLLALVFAFYSCRLAWHSLDFQDISTANDATPLWIPQLAMALGTVIFSIAFIDELVLEWRGRVRDTNAEQLRHE